MSEEGHNVHFLSTEEPQKLILETPMEGKYTSDALTPTVTPCTLMDRLVEANSGAFHLMLRFLKKTGPINQANPGYGQREAEGVKLQPDPLNSGLDTCSESNLEQ